MPGERGAGAKDAGRGEREADEQFGRYFHWQLRVLGQQSSRRVPAEG